MPQRVLRLVRIDQADDTRVVSGVIDLVDETEYLVGESHDGSFGKTTDISRAHAKFRKCCYTWWIIPLNASKFIFANGEKLDEKQVVCVEEDMDIEFVGIAGYIAKFCVVKSYSMFSVTMALLASNSEDSTCALSLPSTSTNSTIAPAIPSTSKNAPVAYTMPCLPNNSALRFPLPSTSNCSTVSLPISSKPSAPTTFSITMPALTAGGTASQPLPSQCSSNGARHDEPRYPFFAMVTKNGQLGCCSVFETRNDPKVEAMNYRIEAFLKHVEDKQKALTDLKESCYKKFLQELPGNGKCSICGLLPRKATRINCGNSHIYCGHCIKYWNRISNECHSCKQKFCTITPDLTIQKFVTAVTADKPKTFRAARRFQRHLYKTDFKKFVKEVQNGIKF